MFRYVTIIALLVGSTYAMAAPRRYAPPQRVKKVKCEKILVPETVQEQVQELAVAVAEMAGELKLKLELQNGPDSKLEFSASDEELQQFGIQLAVMQAAVVQIRKDFSVSVAQVDNGIAALKLMIDEYGPKIKAGLAVATVVKPSAQPARPRNFMKREIFGRGGPLSEMESWSAAEIEAFLRNQNETPAQTLPPSQTLPPPPPNYDFPTPYGAYDNWPPREKP